MKGGLQWKWGFAILFDGNQLRVCERLKDIDQHRIHSSHSMHSSIYSSRRIKQKTRRLEKSRFIHCRSYQKTREESIHSLSLLLGKRGSIIRDNFLNQMNLPSMGSRYLLQISNVYKHKKNRIYNTVFCDLKLKFIFLENSK